MSRKTKLDAFFSWYGGKVRDAAAYPSPTHETVIEPFAGSAGYSTLHYDRRVILFDLDPVVCKLWKYLIESTGDEIDRLPLLDDLSDLRELRGYVPDGAIYLIGLWVGFSRAYPVYEISDAARKQVRWNERVRDRVARQVEHIKHWVVANSSYDLVSRNRATWFVDPPYQGRAGRYYKCNKINYRALGDWCLSLPGQVIVCENQGADWLPFTYLHSVRTATRDPKIDSLSAEVVYTQGV